MRRGGVTIHGGGYRDGRLGYQAMPKFCYTEVTDMENASTDYKSLSVEELTH
jgi:hypothetical protein